MIGFLFFVTLQCVTPTESFLDIIDELNIFACMHKRTNNSPMLSKEDYDVLFVTYKEKAKKNILDCKGILLYDVDVFVYLWAEYNIVIKRITSLFVAYNYIEPQLTKFNHKNIIRTFLCFKQNYFEKEITWVVMEYLPIGIPPDLQLTDYQATILAHDITSGLNCLHKKQIAHLDLNPNNIRATRANIQDEKVKYRNLIGEIVKQLKKHDSVNMSIMQRYFKIFNFILGCNKINFYSFPKPTFYQFESNNLIEPGNNAFEEMNNEKFDKIFIKDSKIEKANPNELLSTINFQINKLNNINLCLEIMRLKPKKIGLDIFLFIVLSNEQFYVTYKDKLDNELVIEVTPYKDIILEMLSFLERFIFSEQFILDTDKGNMITYDFSAYSVIKEKNEIENNIEFITNKQTYFLPDNLDSILHDSRLIFKIFDFNLSLNIKANESYDLKYNSYGTYSYMPPEILTKGICYQKSDFWSLGVMLLLYTYDSRQQNEIKKLDVYELYRYISELHSKEFEILNKYPAIKTLVKHCLVEDVEKRYGAKGLLKIFKRKHEF